MTKLPYSFDLLFDIKTLEHLHTILMEESLDVLFDQGELEELMDELNIPFPDGYTRVNKMGFPRIVWIDKNGGYLFYPPTTSEQDQYQRMRAF